MIIVGTAGWAIPRAAAARFPGDGPRLERYARVFMGVEINSSFRRPHAVEVYEKWAALTPAYFRFSVKLPGAITHDARLRRARRPLEAFLASVAGLGGKLGPLLVQLPPSLEFDTRLARSFLGLMRELYDGAVVCEPRHASWMEPRADALLDQYRVGRVAADPVAVPQAGEPGGYLGAHGDGAGAIVYYRLHGAPRKYWDRYPAERIQAWAAALQRWPRAARVWCIFDNTAGSAAMENALECLQTACGGRVQRAAVVSPGAIR
jgi:uncharacterized protein YecE (DUF72 family)